jgi:hypothetical protein
MAFEGLVNKESLAEISDDELARNYEMALCDEIRAQAVRNLKEDKIYLSDDRRVLFQYGPVVDVDSRLGDYFVFREVYIRGFGIDLHYVPISRGEFLYECTNNSKMPLEEILELVKGLE